MTAPPLTDTLRETLTLFEEGGAPMTTAEVAERVDLGRRSTYERLERLVDHGQLETKKVGGNGRVWWQPLPDERETSRELDDRSDQFHTLVDATEEYAIFMLDPEGYVQTWNPGAERIKGYDADEIVGEHFSKFYTDDDRAAGVPAHNLEEAAQSSSIEDDGWRLRADGSEFWAHVSISAIRGGDGELEGFAKVTRDMTDERAYHRRLEAQAGRLARQRDELESELDEVFDRITDGFYALDDDCCFTYLNDHATDILGIDETAVGTDIRETVALTSSFENALSEALDTQEPVIFEDYYDPVHRWFHNAIYPSESGLSVYFRDITDEKRREQELERYRTIVETVWDGVTALDEDERFVMVNEAFCEMTGYDRDELLGESATLVLDAAVYEHAGELHEQMVDGELDVATLEYDLRTADGTTIPVEARFGPTEFEDKTIGGTGVIRDVTERRERERALEESETRFRMLAENLEEMVWIESPETRELLYVNPAAERIWGRDWEWLYDNPASFLATVHPDDRQRIEQAYEAAVVDGFDEEYRIVRPDGEIRWLDVRALHVHNDAPNESRLVGICDDITVRKEHERALTESERRYRALVEHFPNGAVGLFDDDLRYTAIGGKLVEAVGVSPADRIGNSVHDLYPDELLDEIEPYFEAALVGETNSFEVDYHDRHLFAITLPVRNDDGAVFAGMIVVQDVTERREYQRQLEESNERLEQFAYAASHDLQEPLRMISSYLQLVERRYGDVLDDDGSEFLEFAVDGADRMRSMIDGLLQYSRVGTQGVEFEPVELGAVLEDAQRNLQVKIEERDAEVSVEQLPRVEGDAGQLRQLFQNLLSNAIEYSGDEPPRVQITAERNGSTWTVAVSDDGIGIAADDQDRIFEIFQRLHSHEHHSGTGIGLALCQRIVERHGGELWVDSELGEGATFSVAFPVLEDRTDRTV